MSLMGEEVVVEWLNRDGYFTIRGIRIGNNEIDVLAIKPADGGCECRHIEVSVSVNPIGYLTAHGAKKRSDADLRKAVDEWIKRKFNDRAMTLKQSLCRGKWTKELVLGKIMHEHEIKMLKRKGFIIHRLMDIIETMNARDGVVKSAAGASLFDLMMLFREEVAQSTSFPKDRSRERK